MAPSSAADEPSDGLYVARGISIPAAEIELSAVRSQGAGGQNVNKVASAIQLRFDISASRALPADCKERLLRTRDQRITAAGVVVIKAQQHRSQEQNREAALERLRSLVAQALVVPKTRKATKPTRASKQRRLDDKAHRSRLKRTRGAADD